MPVSKTQHLLFAAPGSQGLDTVGAILRGTLAGLWLFGMLAAFFSGLQLWFLGLAYGLALLYIPLGNLRLAFFGAVALSWIVQREPAPSDLLFMTAAGMALLSSRLRIRQDLQHVSLLGFLAINLVQVVLAEKLQRAAFFAGVSAYLVVLAIMTRGVIDSLREISLFERLYIAATLATALVLVATAVGVRFGLPVSDALLYGGSRPRGYFKDANVAGPFVVSGMGLVISRLLFHRRIPRLADLVTLGVLFLGTVVTFSRGALLNAAAVLVTMVPLAIRWSESRRRMLVLILAVVFVGAPAVWSAWQRFGEMARFTLVTHYDAGGRLAAWASGILMAIDRPFGIGPGQFEVISPEYQKTLPFTEVITPSAHSTYIRVLAENGVVGLVLFLLGVFSVFARSFRIARGLPFQHPMKPTTVWIFSSLAGILVESIVIDTLHWRHLWFLVGLGLALPKLATGVSDPPLHSAGKVP